MKNPEIKIAANTPVWGAAQLLTHIADNGSKYLPNYGDIQIAQNERSGYIWAFCEEWSHCLVADSSGKPEIFFTLHSSGIEFFASDAVNQTPDDMHEDDILQFIDILEELGETERAEEVRAYHEAQTDNV